MSPIIPLAVAAPVEPPVNLPGGNPKPKPGVSFVRSESAIPLHRLHHLEVTRRRLPLTDLDRHDLDIAADRAFAALAPGYPQDAAVTL